MKFDHKIFFDRYKQLFNTTLTQAQVDGLESILTAIEQDPDIADVRWAAYMMATVKHECADRWQPIEEYGKGKGHIYGNPVTVTGSDGKKYTNVYYGRGYVQVTWDYNYKSMSQNVLANDSMYCDPALALDPADAYRIMSYGMRKGTFTGKKLADYINDKGCDYKNARRIINGLDKWDIIQGYAQKLETALRAALLPDTPPPADQPADGQTGATQ
jgi:putative chitinase